MWSVNCNKRTNGTVTGLQNVVILYSEDIIFIIFFKERENMVTCKFRFTLRTFVRFGQGFSTVSLRKCASYTDFHWNRASPCMHANCFSAVCVRQWILNNDNNLIRTSHCKNAKGFSQRCVRNGNSQATVSCKFWMTLQCESERHLLKRTSIGISLRFPFSVDPVVFG